ncbi:hypothetical protein [Legionella israelensis]|uniref:Uncharacterized protein n=1 Tax=Legionella israelensis TaxID=454 RepID=A0A0W0W3F3_9GAMM|nr:hypothetical protein [Legionella israelensis]KTD26842.1 hypothetical protein Lisr_1053 [Legionella israelensis]QBS08511.1 hypothetical protein E4T55_00750 [Legionella israelensis]SCX76895.1 hypothetical protein SAMN02746069_00097 [Legionella israelensis DSM 19235]STX58160.1 Uncharacterised protein [Legionella israelensis]
MTSRKEIIQAIAETENRIRYHQKQFILHRQYWLDIIKNNQLLLITVVLPVVFLLWRMGGMNRVLQWSRQLGGYLMLPALAVFRKKILNAIFSL